MSRQLLHRAALALALVAAGGQLFSLSHLLLVPHTVCREHGELIHLDAAPGSIRHAPYDAEDSSRSYRSADAPGSLDRHDHCLISAIRKDTLALHQAPGVRLPLRAAESFITSPHDIALPRAVATLHLAPKSSPPA
jgi:hypothetical protein